jgi:hypothetical protein
MHTVPLVPSTTEGASVAHVELSLSKLSDLESGDEFPELDRPELDSADRTGDGAVERAAGADATGAGSGSAEAALDRWRPVVVAAEDPCVLVDASGVVRAASPGCDALFAVAPAHAVGRHLLDGVLRLLDFNAVSGELPDWEADKIPPLLAVASKGLARGLLRVPGMDGVARTVDAVSAPLRHDGVVIGSMTFFAPVTR